MQRLLRLIVLVCAFATMHTSLAETAPLARFADADARHQLAKSWLNGITALEQSVPTLSPEQQAWFQREYIDEIQHNGGRYTKRALAASDSREYQLVTVRPPLERLERALAQLADSAPTSRLAEVTLWIEVATYFMDHDLWQSVSALVREGVLNKQIDGVDDLYFENHVLWAQAVLRGVIPMIESAHR